jgi:hypothetical protein
MDRRGNIGGRLSVKGYGQGRTRRESTVADAPPGSEGVWLERDEPGSGPVARRGRVVVTAVCLGLVGALVGFTLWGGSRTSKGVHVEVSPAMRVISALGATVASGRWNMTFETSFTPPSGTAAGAGPALGLSIAGHGTTNLNPFAMVAYANIAGIGPVTTMMNSSKVWEFGGGQYGTTGSDSGPGASIAGFAPLVEGTLGPEQGAVAMMGLGSATGYLDLVQQAITTATATGTGTLDGSVVTYFRVAVDPTKLLSVSGTTPEEVSALQDALQLLTQHGYQAMTDTVAVDQQGYIRGITQIVTFSDGGVATNRTTFSDLGCAPTVVLPGGRSPTTATAPCKPPSG